MHDPMLLHQLQSRYQVGPEYASAYLDFWTQPGGRHAGRVFTSLEEILSLPAPDSTWFDYALSTNTRAHALCALSLEQSQTPAHPQRFLDIGCGFGGLLAAFAARGLEVRGIEIDPDRVTLARANCRDQGLPDVVSHGDILEDRSIDELGRFDVIAMIDVIEHVLDVPRALAQVVRLLNPGGVVLMEIPNRSSLAFVAADGHFGLFGITLLDRADAITYQQAMFSFPYDVGDYFPLEEYRMHYERLGCDLVQIDSPFHATGRISDVPAFLSTIQTNFDKYRADIKPRVPLRVDAALQIKLAEFTSALLRDYRGAPASEAASAAFVNSYLIDFWTVLAQKRAG